MKNLPIVFAGIIFIIASCNKSNSNCEFSPPNLSPDAHTDLKCGEEFLGRWIEEVDGEDNYIQIGGISENNHSIYNYNYKIGNKCGSDNLYCKDGKLVTKGLFKKDLTFINNKEEILYKGHAFKKSL